MASYYGNILEEELKNKVAAEWFADYDATQRRKCPDTVSEITLIT